jgi:hypothetical protein
VICMSLNLCEWIHICAHCSIPTLSGFFPSLDGHATAIEYNKSKETYRMEYGWEGVADQDP